MFTERFTEAFNPIAYLKPGSYATEQNTARFAVGNYRRFVVILTVGATFDSTLDLDVEQHLAATGGTPANVTGKSITQLVAAPTEPVIVEIRTEELAAGKDYLSIEITPSGATVFGVLVLAFAARHEPVDNTGWAEIVD